jgi:Tfp pilus assembly protein PilZ
VAEESDGRERRRFARVALEAQVSVRVEDSDHLFESHIRDLSENGVFIVSDGTRPIGTNVKIRVVVVKEGVELIANGIIVHEVKPDDGTGRPAGVGVMFTNVESPEQLQELMKKGEAI